MTIHTRVDDWRKVTITERDSFATALKRMSEGGYQLVMVRTNEGSLAGMVTDSDIRKALLRGVSLDQTVDNIMNRSPLVVSPELSDSEAHNLMLLNHFFHLPIVENSGILVGLHVANQLRTTKPLEETLVIMAGGRGKRLMPLTAVVPKPMLPVKGRPILEHIIDRAKLEGFRKLVITVNYLSDIITSHFGNGSDYGVDIYYLTEDKPLGTAGSLASLPEEYKQHPVVVTNADVITNVAYSDLLAHSLREGVDGLMAVRTEEWHNPFGVVHSQGNKIMSIEEKPVHRHQVNAGMYVLGKSLLDLLEKDSYCDMPELFERGLERGLDLRVFPLHESWIDVGRIEDYNLAQSLDDKI